MKANPLKISLDYDETFTRDKTLWALFALTAIERGHQVAFVTFRGGPGTHWDNRDIFADAEKLGIDIYFSNGNPKSQVYKADIWIDDMPELVRERSPFVLFGSQDD